MGEKVYDLGSYLDNPPSIFEIIGNDTKSRYPHLQMFLKNLHDEILPLLINIDDILGNARNQMENTLKMKENHKISMGLQDLEKEYLWAQFIEIEAQQRAISDLVQKLEGEISVSSVKHGEISSSLSSMRPQIQQKNDTVQTEFKKFRAVNAELQQLFKDQNQILRKINQVETDLNNPKMKKTPEEISNLEKELEGLSAKEQKLRQKLPQKQIALDGQRLLHQQKEKEFRPLKVKYDELVAENAKLEQLLTTDKSRLEEKQKELSEISTTIQEFLKSNNLDPKDRPATIRTKSIIEGKMTGIKANLRPDSLDISNTKSPSIEIEIIFPVCEKLTGILETFQDKQIQDEIHTLSREIVILRNKLSSKFSNLMNGIGAKGGVQVCTLISSGGILRFIESDKENSFTSILAFLLALYGGNTNQIQIDTHNISPRLVEDLQIIIKTFRSKTDAKILMSEA